MSKRATKGGTLKHLMTEVIGSGPKSATDMSREQARAAFQEVLAQEADPTTLGAFFLANRWKGNTPTELAGFVDVMREESVRTPDSTVEAVDCGANYDGKARSALLGVAAAIVAAATGTSVVLHSGDRVPTQHGCTYKHVLDALEISTELTPEKSANMLEEIGVGFYYQPTVNPGIHALLDRREQMGVRTLINTIETLANPANATVHIGSFYHLAFAKKLIGTVEASEQLGFDRVVVFQGMEGYDDIRPGYTKMAEWRDNTITTSEIETAKFGMDFESEDLAVADVPTDSAHITREVLTGDRTDNFLDAIALNAGLRLYAAGTTTTLDEGVSQSLDAIADGSAATVLDELTAWP